MIAFRPKRWSEKPPVGTQINWGHPLAAGLVGAWLVNENGGKTLRDLVTPAGVLNEAPRPNPPTWSSSTGAGSTA